MGSDWFCPGCGRETTGNPCPRCGVWFEKPTAMGRRRSARRWWVRFGLSNIAAVLVAEVTGSPYAGVTAFAALFAVTSIPVWWWRSILSKERT